MTSFNSNSGRPFKNNDRQFTRQKHNFNKSKHRKCHRQYDHANQNNNVSLEHTSRPLPHQGSQRFELDYEYNEYSQRSEYELDLQRSQYQDNNLTQNIVSRAVAKALNTFDPLDDLNNSIDFHTKSRPLLNKTNLPDHTTANKRHGHKASRNAHAHTSTSANKSRLATDPIQTKASKYPPRNIKQNPTVSASNADVYHLWKNSPQDLRVQTHSAKQKTVPDPESRKNNHHVKSQDKGNDKIKGKANKKLWATQSCYNGTNAKFSSERKVIAQPSRTQQEQRETQKSRNTHENNSKTAFTDKQNKQLNKSKPPRKPNTITKTIEKSYKTHVQEQDPQHLNYLVLPNNYDSSNTTEPLVQTIISRHYKTRDSYYPQSHLRTQLISIHTAKGTVRAQTEKNIRRRPSNRRPYHP